MRPVGADPRFSPSEPAGLRVCRLSVFCGRASSSARTLRRRAYGDARVAARILTVAVPAALLVAVAWAERRVLPPRMGRAAGRRRGRDRVRERSSRREVELGRRRAVFVGGLVALAAWALVSRAWAVAPGRRRPRGRAHARLRGARRSGRAPACRAAGSTSSSRRARRRGRRQRGRARAARPGGGAPIDRLELPIGYTNAAGIVAGVADRSSASGSAARDPCSRAALAPRRLPAGGRRALPVALAWRAARRRARGRRAAPRRAARPAAGCGMALVALVTAVATGLVAWASRSRAQGARRARSPGWLSFSRSRRRPRARHLLRPGADVAAPPRAHRRRPGRRRALAAVAVAIGVAAVVAVRGDRPMPAAAPGRVRPPPLVVDELPRRLLDRRGGRGARPAAARRSARAASSGAGSASATRCSTSATPTTSTSRRSPSSGRSGWRSSRRSCSSRSPARRRVVASATGRAALAAYVALLAHAALDWDWELPVVTLCTLLLAVVLLGLGRETAPARSRRSSRRRRRCRRGRSSPSASTCASPPTRRSGANAALDRGDAVRRAQQRPRGAPPHAVGGRALAAPRRGRGRGGPARDRAGAPPPGDARGSRRGGRLARARVRDGRGESAVQALAARACARPARARARRLRRRRSLERVICRPASGGKCPIRC